jgi:iron complex outermembrane receptor protein
VNRVDLSSAARTLSCAAACTFAIAQQAPRPAGAGEPAELSLEQLLQLPVEVAARQGESLATTAAAVYVLDETTIRRSGMRSVGELLRLVPGLIIAQDVPGAYGFSSRIGEYEFAGMLVLIDGQRLYPTLVGREYFQAIDLPVEVIQRIEVLAGPGGARWGDKASQGVINIVTKKASDAQGASVSGLAGTEERLLGNMRVGAPIGDASHFYVYGQVARRDGGWPNTAGDRWDNNNIGARIDSKVSDNAELSFDGFYHDSFLGDSFEIDPGFSSLNYIKGGHVKSRLRFDHGGGEWTELRGAIDGYDQDVRDYRNNVPDEHLRYREQMFDLAVQHSFRLAPDHTITVGVDLRSLAVSNFLVVAGTGRHYNATRSDVFATWDWDVASNVRITLGGNVGYQDGPDGSGADAQPDARVSWAVSKDTTLWTALSANREPDQKIPDSGVLVTREASHLLAWELGWRQRIGEVALLQANGFAYKVSNQVNGTFVDPGTGATMFVNNGSTDAFGGELVASWLPFDHARATAWVAATEANSRHFDPATFPDPTTIEGQVPPLRGGLTAGFDPVPGFELDTNLLYTQEHAGIPTWWRLDLRAGWHTSPQTLWEVVGQNLTDPHHPESFFLEEVQRGFYVMFTHAF